MKSNAKTVLAVSAVAVASFALPLIPVSAHAQAIDTITQATTGHVNNAWGYLLNSVCWVLGGSLLLGSIWGLYQKHRNNSGMNASMGKIVAGALCGAILVGFPFYVKTASFTIWDATSTVTGEQKMMTFDK